MMLRVRPWRRRRPGVRIGGRMRAAGTAAPGRLPRARIVLRWRRPRNAAGAAVPSSHIHALTLSVACRLHVVLNFATEMRLLLEQLAAPHAPVGNGSLAAEASPRYTANRYAGRIGMAGSAYITNAPDVRGRHHRRLARLELPSAALGRFFVRGGSSLAASRAGVRGGDGIAMPRLRRRDPQSPPQAHAERPPLQRNVRSAVWARHGRTANNGRAAGFPQRLRI